MSHVVALPSHMMHFSHHGVTMSFSFTSSFTLPAQLFILVIVVLRHKHFFLMWLIVICFYVCLVKQR